MRNFAFLLLMGVLISGISFSCRKSHNSSQTCNLASMSDSTTSVESVTQFTYDNQNRVSSIVVTGQNACTRTFQYIGNSIIFTVKDTTPGILAEIDTVLLNSNNLMQSFSSYFPSSGSTYAITYFYDLPGVQQATRSVSMSNGEADDTVGYFVANGDLIYDSIQGQTTHKDDFTYYASKGIVYGDPTYFRQLLYYGAYYYINVHMLNSLYTAGKFYKAFTYTYSNNRISKQSLRQCSSGSTDTVTHTISYAYTCK